MSNNRPNAKFPKFFKLIVGKNGSDPPLYVRLQKFIFGEKFQQNKTEHILNPELFKQRNYS